MIGNSQVLVGNHTSAAYLINLKRMVNIVGMVLILSFLAQMRIPLIFTPVPIVCTQIGIAILAAYLNRKDGMLAIMTYIVAGGAGLPIFSGFNGGLSALTGPTGGYIAGYLLAFVYLSNYLHNREEKTILNIFSHIFLAQLLIYIPGLIHLSLWMSATQTFSVQTMLIIGFLPFIVGDVIKAMIVSSYMKIVCKCK